MQQVRVHAERRLAALVLGDRNLVLFGKFQQLGPAGQVPFAPGRDHLDVRVQRIGGQFKPYLIVALAGGTVRHGIGADLGCDLDQPLGNQRARDGRSQQIQTFVQCVRPKHRKHEIADEFFTHVLDVDRGRAHHLGLLAGGFQFLALTKIGGKGDDLAAIFGLQPFQDDGCVQTARIGEDDFLGGGHGCGLCVNVV